MTGSVIILWQSSSQSWAVTVLFKCQFWQSFAQYKTTMSSDFFWSTVLLIECKVLKPKLMIKHKFCFATFYNFYFPKQHMFRKILLFCFVLFCFYFFYVYFRTTDWEPPCWADFCSCRTDVSLLQSSFVKDFSSASNLIVANYGNWIGK